MLNMVLVKRTEKLLVYATWYGFKKDLERRLGHPLLNRGWLRVKPRAPLPWDLSHMRAALDDAARLLDNRCMGKGIAMQSAPETPTTLARPRSSGR